MWRRIGKQLLYGLFYLALWGILGFLIYMLFLKPAPSCFDNIQNQSEEGVDCGGPCQTECLPQFIEPLSARGGVSIFPVDSRHVDALVEIVNLNTSEAARSFNYAFTFYGASGASTTPISGKSYVYAGEIKYLAVSNVSVSEIPAYADLTLSDPSWVAAGGFHKPKLAIQNYTTIVAPSGNLEVDGRIINQDAIPFDAINIVAIFYSSSGGPAAVSNTLITNLNLNESKAFTISHPNIRNVNLAATKVYAYAYHP